ncbi:hypothetical protein CsSME_00018240 [Camellia sinensis var. sinensis]
MKISFFLCSEELLAFLRETLKSVKDIPRILKKFNSPSSACTTGDWTAFLKRICSLPHVNKIFEVGISGSLREQMKFLNLDIAGSCILIDLAYVYELVIPRLGSSVLQSGVANDFNKMPENVSHSALLATQLHLCSKFCLCLSKGLLV